MSKRFEAITLCSLLLSFGIQAAHAAETWQTITAIGAPTARHEAACIAFQGKVYLIGGRRVNPVDVFDPSTLRWSSKSPTPVELHHFQAVTFGDHIYLMGAMTGPYPNEKPLENVIAYHPPTDQFKTLGKIPQQRRRGGAGAVVYQDKIYLVGGITNGHVDGYQPWFDEYDPKTEKWTVLPDAPHARDHFQAVVIGDRLYAAAGRTTSKATDQVFDLTVEKVDIFDFKTGKWLEAEACPTIPTPRAGNMATTVNGQLILGGGESMRQRTAHNEIDIYNPETKVWVKGASLLRGRHGSGFARIGNYLYTASGCGNRGGTPELDTIERLETVEIGATVDK